MSTPPSIIGLRHIALFANNFEACEKFYTELVGLRVEWRPDADNVYLTSGYDNLALHRSNAEFSGKQHLDHIGFVLSALEHTDLWHDYLLQQGVKILAAPRTHRDGARSFYCHDPDGNTVQFIFHPPLARTFHDPPTTQA